MSARKPLGRALLVTSVLLITASALLPGVAEAGCLTEHRGCRDCASRMLRRAMFRFSASGVLDANVALWDCDIDLYHCVVLGQHHGAACTI